MSPAAESCPAAPAIAPAIDAAEHLGLAFSVAARFKASARRLGIDPADVEGEARLALVQAARLFDPARGCTFATFAFPVLRNALLRRLYPGRPWPGQLPQDQEGRDFEPAAPEPGGPGIEDSELLGRLLEALPSRTRDLVQRAFGVACERESMVDLGRAMGLTPERIRQVVDQGLRRMRAQAERLHAGDGVAVGAGG